MATNVRVDLDAVRVIREQTLRARPMESAGLLLGTLEGGVWDVREASGPGPEVQHSAGHVSPDNKYLNARIAAAERRGLVFLGEWHSHPDNLTAPTSGDDRTIAETMKKCGLDSFLAGIATVRDALFVDLYVYDAAGRRRVHGFKIALGSAAPRPPRAGSPAGAAPQPTARRDAVGFTLI